MDVDQLSSVRVQAASRLHFGLFSFGSDAGETLGAPGRAYGGVGMMVNEPRLELTFTRAESFSATGPLAERVVDFSQRWSATAGDAQGPRCRIEVVAAPPQHAGFGVGTQLGLSVIAGLNALFARPPATAQQLAAVTSRGARSAVGVYGFLRGGLIVEDGKLPGEALSPILQRCELPQPWRVVLIRPREALGLSGQYESATFADLPPVSKEVTNMLRREVAERMLPALAAADFERFSRSVYKFGKAAGECFAAVQGGAYNGALLRNIVDTARRLGVAGVGQSSWGPTIFCLFPDKRAADDIVTQLKKALGSKNIEYTVTSPCNHGTVIQRREPLYSFTIIGFV